MTKLTLDYAQLLRNGAYIDGAWVTADAVIAVRNPADGSIVGSVPTLAVLKRAGRLRRRSVPSATGVCCLPSSAARSFGAGAN